MGFPPPDAPCPPPVAPNKYLQGMPGLVALAGVRAPTLFQAALEVGGADVATPHGALHVLLKQPPVVLQDLSGFFVQWVFGVGLLCQYG